MDYRGLNFTLEIWPEKARSLQVNNRLDGSIPSNAVNNRNEPSGIEKLIRKWTLEDGTEGGLKSVHCLFNLSAGSGPFEDQWQFFPSLFLET